MPQRLAAAANEPQNWFTYSGNYSSTRYSPLSQITPANVKSLKLQWVYQSPVAGNWQTTPLVVDGIMYLTQRQNDVVALDATTGRAFWTYRYTPAQDRIVCCGANNRGLAILGNTLFMGTLDAQLIAIDAKIGRPLWKTSVATTTSGYSITHAPLFSPRTGLFYVSAWEDYASIYAPAPAQYTEGRNFGGGGPRNLSAVPGAPGLGRSPINTWTEAAGHGAVIALDPATGQEKWKFTMTDVTDSGILTTGSDLLFTGGREGYFQALDARTGALLWKTQLGAMPFGNSLM